MFDKGKQCREVFENVEYVYRVCHALGRSWQYLQPERRQESITRLREKLVALTDVGIAHPEKKMVRLDDAGTLLKSLETLERYNRGEGTIHNLPEVLESPAAQMAINAIADCACPTDQKGRE